MATPNKTPTRPWMTLEALGLRVLHARDSKDRHMLMLAPLDYEESPSASSERLDGYKERLAAAVKAFQGEGVRGSFITQGRFAGTFCFTGDKLGSFRGMVEVIRSAFPEVRMTPETPAHFIRLPQYIQYRQQQQMADARKELTVTLTEANREMPDDLILELQGDRIDLVDTANETVVRNERPASRETLEALFDHAQDLGVRKGPRIDINEDTIKLMEGLALGARQIVNPWIKRRMAMQSKTMDSLLMERQKDVRRIVDGLLDTRADEELVALAHQAEILAELGSPEISTVDVDWWEYHGLIQSEIQKREQELAQAIQAEKENREAAEARLAENEKEEAQKKAVSPSGDGDGGAVAPRTVDNPQYSLEELITMRDAMEEQLDRQGQFMDSRLMDRLKKVDATIAEMQAAPVGGESGWGNGQQGDEVSKWTLLGENVDGYPLWEDARGIRAVEESPGFRQVESVGMAFTRQGIQAHRADRKDSYRTVEEMAERAPAPLNEGQLIRAAFVAQEADLGEATAVEIDYQGEQRSFLVTQKHPTPRDGHQLASLNVRRIRVSKEQQALVVDDLLVTPRNTLERQGLPRSVTGSVKAQWQQAGLTLPVVDPAVTNRVASPEELENPYNRQLTPLTFQDFQEKTREHTTVFRAAQQALQAAIDSGDTNRVRDLNVQVDSLEWELMDLEAGYMMTALIQDDWDPSKYPTKDLIIKTAENYPALAERYAQVTGVPMMAGPWPRAHGHLQAMREQIKGALELDRDNQILKDRLLDVESDMELAAEGIPRSGWGNGQYMNRDNPVLGSGIRDNLALDKVQSGEDHGTDAAGAPGTGDPQSGGSPVERADGGPADSGRPGAGDGAGESGTELTPGEHARGVEGAGGSDGRTAGDDSSATEGSGSPAVAGGAGRTDGGDADRGSVREGADGSLRAGAAGGDGGRSSEGDTGLVGGSESTGQTEPSSAGTASGEGRSEDAGSVRAGTGADDRGDGAASPEQERSDGSDLGGDPRADGSDRGSDEQSGSEAQSGNTTRLTGWRFKPGHDHEGKSRSQRVDDNIVALDTLFELEAQGRKATPEESAILAEYSGWGGIDPHLFTHTANAPAYVDLARRTVQGYLSKGLMKSAEYANVKGSVLNAHYTHSGVIAPMWEAIERMGVPAQRILEPSSGTLNFKNYLPQSLADKARFTAVELDSLTARIAQQLHPDARVHACGYEDAPVRSNFYDVAISNVPFGEYKVFDRKNPKWNHSIHNYFFLKSLDDVRPGGITAFITSSHTMDGQDETVRRAIAEKAHLVGAVRLPAGTFSQNTQTDVQTDIIFLQKKGDFEPSYTPRNFLHSTTIAAPLRTSSAMHINDKIVQPGEDVPMRINQYFADHPEHVLGELGVKSGPFGPVLSAHANLSIPELQQRLSQTLETLPANLAVPVTVEESADVVAKQQRLGRTGGNADDLMPGEIVFVEESGDFRSVVVNAEGETFASSDPVKVPKKAVPKMKALVEIMGTARRLLILQSEGDDDSTEAQIVAQRDSLNALYDDFRTKHGEINTKVNEKLFDSDPRAPFLYGLEYTDPESGEVQKSDVFHKRVVEPTVKPPTRADSPEDALAISLAYTGKVSLGYITELLADHPDLKSVEQVRQHLLDKELIFINPKTETPETRDEYLSGNLRPKLELAKESAAGDPVYERNVAALEAVWPAPLKPSQIKVGIDASWLPKDVLESFISEQINIPVSASTTGTAKVDFDNLNRHWRMDKNGSVSMAQLARNYDQAAMHRWGTERCHAFRILDHAFTNTVPTVRDKISENPDKWVINTAETNKAQAKLEEIKDAFDQWVFRDGARARRLTDFYNENYNTMRLVEPDGSHMVYPGMSPGFIPRKHQNDFVWRSISGKNAMTAHVVGAGKTMQLIGTAVRGKQLGRWKKPMTVVPNHMLRQFAADAQKIYPSARILVLDKKDINPKKRADFVAKAAMGDWDLVITTHSSFGRIGVPADFERQMLEEEKENLESHLRLAEKDGKGYLEREIQTKLKRLEANLKKLYEMIEKNREDVLNLEQMGIDYMGLDEAHYYKNLSLDSAKQIPGVSASESARAWDVYMKCRYLHEIHDGPYGVTMATGTPISNSVTECYTFTRMLRPDLLRDSNIHNFNDWVGLYGEIKFSLETKPEGGGVQLKGRLSQFKNVPELIQMIRMFIDFKTREDLNLPTPDVEHETVVAQPSDTLKEFMKYIEARARGVREKSDDGPTTSTELATAARTALYGANDKRLLAKSESEREEAEEEATDGVLPTDILLSIATDGRKASLDPRLIHPDLPDDPNSKVNLCVNKAFEIYEKHHEHRAAQMIFCDFSSPTGKGIFNVYDDIKKKLIAKGVPAEEIAFIHDAKTDDDKEALFEKVRSGEVRFLLGSTQKMGVGTNVQERLIALHQLDPPWKPSDIEQRLGRMERQGNMFDQTYNFQYVTQDGFDLFMWETLNRKLSMIRQAMRKPEEAERELQEDAEMGFEDILAVTTGNPKIRDFIEARLELDKLKRKHDNHVDEQADLGGRIATYEDQIESYDLLLAAAREEVDIIGQNQPLHLEVSGSLPGVQDGDTSYIGGLKGLAEALENQAKFVRRYTSKSVGTFGGLRVEIDCMDKTPSVHLVRHDGQRMYMGSPKTEEQQTMAQMRWDQEDEPKKPAYYAVANKLAHRLRQLGTGEHIDAAENAKAQVQSNLEQARDMKGLPFRDAEKLEEVRKTYQALSEELGDAVDESKGMDPAELIPWLERIKDLPRVDLQRELAAMPSDVREQLGLDDPELSDDSDDYGTQIQLA